MVNLTYPELAEISNSNLPPASVDALKTLRNQMCESSSGGFKLQSQQKFLRRILSPDSPLRNLIMVHGTGSGKTCSAIQIAEEYILRPEFQEKKVMVVASAAVQQNFRTQIFDMSRVNLDFVSGTLESKQCTGRRYLDMLMRIESEPKNWNDPEVREKLDSTAKKIINEFYEFVAYTSFGNMINEKLSGTKADIDEQWVHDNFDNRLLIIDEAHNITEAKDNVGGIKGITRGLENLVKTANGLVLVLLTATPMYDTFDTIVFYMNLFLWNDRKQKETEMIKVSDIFNSDGTLKPNSSVFRNWCSEYVSFIKGENPFTFPFRLSPPQRTDDLPTVDFKRKAIADVDRLKYLTLVGSIAEGVQSEILSKESGEDSEEKKVMLMQPTLLVLPGNKTFNETFRLAGKQYEYVSTPCLTPETLKNHSIKFATVIDTILKGQGIALVYSNFVAMGARPFAMALEEHGFSPALGSTILAKPSYTGTAKGKYILLSSSASESEFNQMLTLVKSKKNRDGDQVRVIVMSPMAAEGIDFRYVRQIHILDPWWNMSRIEQVIGRGLRTCSHQLLPFEQQNCTVYLHVVRTGGRECYDEYTYRTRVEQKAIRIARVRKVMAESAMDCPMQNMINTLPEDWRNLEVPQRRSENGEEVVYRLAGMLAPAFDDAPDVEQCIVPTSEKDTEHVRPLSTYLDVRDEVLEKLGRLMIDKPIWDREDLLAGLRPFTPEVAMYNIQHAIQTGFRFKDVFGRSSLLESRGDLYALSPDGTINGTIVDRASQPVSTQEVRIPAGEESEEPEETEMTSSILDERRASFKFPLDATTRFSEELLNGFVFDHLLTDEEKRVLLKQKPNLPFAQRLYVPNSEYIVLGDKTFEPAEPPIGRDLTEFQAWNDALVARFIENKATLFASVRNGKLTVSKLTVQEDGTVVRKIEKTAKKYDPITCGTGDHDIKTMGAFAKFIDKNGKGGPGKFANAVQLCMYAELLAREEHNCIWITPEELSVLYDNKENKAKFTKDFKK